MRIFYILVLIFPLFILSGCIEQSVVDEKMARGCMAGVDALTKGREIIEVKKTTPTSENFQGEGLHRRVTIDVLEKDGWLEVDKQYSCVFLEEWGMFRSTHRALLMQIDIEGTIYGKNNGNIVGDWDDFLKLTRVVDAAMAQ